MPVVFSFVVNMMEVMMARKSVVIPVILLGLGKVGRALVNLIMAGRGQLEERRGITIRLLGVADSTGALVKPGGLTDPELACVLSSKSEGKKISGLTGSLPLKGITDLLEPGTILVDATASDATYPFLNAALLKKGGIALSNKRPLVLPWDEAKVFYTHACVGYEATVGAGLPVISTLRALLDTGDRIRSIDGVLSGTLGYLMSQLEQGVPYSRAVLTARALGYTEPDPREDLGGKDVARKGVILARTAGWPIELENLAVTPLYPPSFARLSTEEFMHALSGMDEEYAQKVIRAKKDNQVLRYVMHITPEGGTVGLAAVERTSALGILNGPENTVTFHSAFYDETPLGVHGPGAGPQVTATAVLKDIIDLATRLPERREQL